jgi:hypothetical protein
VYSPAVHEVRGLIFRLKPEATRLRIPARGFRLQAEARAATRLIFRLKSL